MALQGIDIGALKKSLKEILVTDRAHPDTFNPIIQDLINNDVTLEALSKSYTDQQIQLVTETGVPKLVSYQYNIVASQDGQVNFNIPLQTFDKTTDTIIVHQNRTHLENNSYSISNNILTLSNGVKNNTSIHIMIFKNVAVGPEGSINGATLAINSIPINRLQDFNANKISVIDVDNNFLSNNVEDILKEIYLKNRDTSKKAEELENLYWMGGI